VLKENNMNLGTALKIEGVREMEHGKFASHILVVDTLNGQKLTTLIKIWIQMLGGQVFPRKPDVY